MDGGATRTMSSGIAAPTEKVAADVSMGDQSFFSHQLICDLTGKRGVQPSEDVDLCQFLALLVPAAWRARDAHDRGLLFRCRTGNSRTHILRPPWTSPLQRDRRHLRPKSTNWRQTQKQHRR
jgi:hypothetical protein